MKNANKRTPEEEERYQRSLNPEQLASYLHRNTKQLAQWNDVKPCMHAECRCKSCKHLEHGGKFACCRELDYIPSDVFFDNAECAAYQEGPPPIPRRFSFSS